MSEQPRPGRAPAWVTDAALGTAVTVALTSIIALGQTEPDAPWNAVAYVFAAGFGAVLLLRRTLPRTVLILSILGTFAYYTLEFPPIGVAVPVAAALFSAAEAGLTRFATGAGAAVFTVSLFFRIRDDPQPLGYLLGYESVSNIALIAAAIALGYGVHATRIAATRQERIRTLTDAQVARETEWRVQAEREAISRELHDTIGHTLSVVALHAGVGGEAVGRDDARAREAFERVRDESTRSLHDLRSMVRILRSDPSHDPGREVLSLTGLPSLLESARTAGVAVTTRIDVRPDDLSTPVDTAAYRVIQESITNVIRHADAGSVHIAASLDGDLLHLTVTDDGTRATRHNPGYGITGMTERVRLLGGDLTTRTESGAGFTVDATMPARLPS